MFVGVGAGRVRDMFKNAKQNAPCIIFIDEIDAVGRQRGAGLGGGNDEREQTLNQLLVEMDGFADNAGIIVIAATNRDDVLDPALLRAGRFDRKITVSLPDKAGREAIFKVHARNKKIDTAVDFGNLAKRTVGFSGADIASVLNDAAILSVRNGSPLITLAEIDEAIDRRIAGPAKSSRALSELERKTIAYHEAGHAIIGLNLPFSDKVQKITIVPRGNTGGHVLMTPEDDRFLVTKNELMARITGYLGGRTSEEVFFDDISTGAHNDIEVATRIARAMVVEYGMSSLGPIQYEQVGGNVFLGRDYTSAQRNFSQEVALAIDKEIRHIVDTCHAQARKVIEEHRDDLILIANTLLERESITAEQIDYLLKYRTLDVFPAEPQQNAEILEDVTPIEPNSGDVIDE
jgi:cell division protease FtsH